MLFDETSTLENSYGLSQWRNTFFYYYYYCFHFLTILLALIAQLKKKKKKKKINTQTGSSYIYLREHSVLPRLLLYMQVV